MHRPQDLRTSSSVLSIAYSEVSQQTSKKDKGHFLACSTTYAGALLFITHTDIQCGKNALRQK